MGVGPNAGMYCVFGIGAGNIALLDGVTLTWTQDSKKYFPCGSMTAVAAYRGPVSWEGSFKKAFENTALLGTAYVGTASFLGTIFPVGGTNPLIAGTITLKGGGLSNMERENLDITEEEHKFDIVNMTFTN